MDQISEARTVDVIAIALELGLAALVAPVAMRGNDEFFELRFK